MQYGNKHNLLIGLLALAVVFAPMQAAVSAIAMLAHDTGQPHHCQTQTVDQMDHDGGMDHDSMDHGDCCQHDGACPDNCPACTQCMSGHAALLGLSISPQPPLNQFVYLKTSPIKGISGRNAYRPPRFFS